MKKIMNKKSSEQAEKAPMSFEFARINYILLIIGLVVLLTGYLVMVGGGSDDPSVFSEKIFDFRRLTLAPILIIIGFGIEVVAILYHPKK
jgi:hypothetical protein